MSLLSHDDQGIMYNFNQKMPIKNGLHSQRMHAVGEHKYI